VGTFGSFFVEVKEFFPVFPLRKMFFDSNVWNFGLSYKTYPFLFVP
jgi:hypothetical protein